MDCRAPDAIHEEDLVISALDPDALTAEARQHLAECPACAERAAEYQTFTRTLSTRLYRWDCPTTLEISEYATGLLPAKRQRQISAHLKHCSHCTEEVAMSRDFLAQTPQGPARPTLIARLLPRRITETAQAGLRGSAGDAGWPRQYQVNGVSLSLHRAATVDGEAGALLLGLISRADTAPEAFAGLEVRLLVSGVPDLAPLAIELIDDLGNFVLNSVPAGRYDLLIALPEGDMVIEDLELGE